MKSKGSKIRETYHVTMTSRLTSHRLFLLIIVYITCYKHLLPLVEAVDNTLSECRSFDLVIMLDSSSSLRDSDPIDRPLQTWRLMVNFTTSFIYSLPTNKDISFSVIKYSSTPEVVQSMSPRQQLLDSAKQQLNTMTFIGSNTDTSAALDLGKQQLRESQQNRSRLGLLITDGLSTISQHTTQTKANELKDDGVELYVLGITRYIDKKELMDIASKPETKYFTQLIGQGQLEEVLQKMLNRVCNLPDPSETPPKLCEFIPGCKICISDPRICDECLQGYYRDGWNCPACPPNCENCTSSKNCQMCKIGFYRDPITGVCRACKQGMDLAFIIDSSGSIRDKNPKDKYNQTLYDNYGIILSFVQKVIDRLPIGTGGADDTRVAVVTFSDTAQVTLYLNTYDNRGQINAAIEKNPYYGSNTNTSGALRVLRSQVFTQAHGDRAGVMNVGIVITDGESTWDKNLTIPEAQRCRAAGITLFAVGATNEINMKELDGIASEPPEKYVFYSDYIIDLTANVLQQLAETLCNGI